MYNSVILHDESYTACNLSNWDIPRKTAEKPKNEIKAKSILIGTIFAMPLVRVHTINILQTEINIDPFFRSKSWDSEPRNNEPAEAGHVWI